MKNGSQTETTTSNRLFEVIVIDDEPALALLLTCWLQAQGCRVITLPHCEAALRHLEGEWPDALILDACLPGMGSVEFLRRLRAQPQGAELPVYLLTGAPDSELARQLASLDVLGVYQKATDVPRLAGEIERYRERRNQAASFPIRLTLGGAGPTVPAIWAE